MDTTYLTPLIRKFLESQSSDPVIKEVIASKARRSERARRLLQPDKIPTLTKEEVQELMQDTDNWFGLRWNKQEFWEYVFGANDEKLPALRAMFDELVRKGEAGLTAQDFDAFDKLKTGLGRGYLSELLALRFPDKYWLLNKQVYDFLRAQGIDLKAELPRGKKGDPGEEYIAAGRHLGDLRRALSEASGQSQDQLFADMFIYWANKQQAPDPWEAQIAAWMKQEFPPVRLQTRRDAEERARNVIKNKLGQFAEADVLQLLTELDVDWYKGKVASMRFGLAFATPGFNQMVKDLSAFNTWLARLWETDDNALDTVLDQLWKETPVGGWGVAFPSVMLYLRDPMKYNILMPTLLQGLKTASGLDLGKKHLAANYRQYNQAACEFREHYHMPPQAVDIILTIIGKRKGGGEPPPPPESRYTLDQLMADTFLAEDFLHEVESLLEHKGQIVFYGPPGTGKTWVARHFGRYWVEASVDPGGKVEILQFHPSYAYEEFVEGIRPASVEGKDGRRELSYPIRKGRFLSICDDAREHPEQRFVLILDEINRGELPRIFGELLYALEYRDESVTLPYSGEGLTIPKNLYLIGTMNTADRSIALVDHALRRRFHFIDLRPDAEYPQRFHGKEQSPRNAMGGRTAEAAEPEAGAGRHRMAPANRTQSFHGGTFGPSARTADLEPQHHADP